MKKRLLGEVAVDREVALCNSGQVPVNEASGRTSWVGRSKTEERGQDGLVSHYLHRPNPKVPEECEMRQGQCCQEGSVV